MERTISKHLFENPEDFPTINPNNNKTTVHNGQTYRIDKAREQAQREVPSVERVIKLVNEALTAMGVKPVANPLIEIDLDDIAPDGTVRLDYDRIAKDHQLADRRDVVYIRFDREGRPVLVAVSDDVNFCPIPKNPDEYDEKMNDRWKYTTAAIILSALGSDWDCSYLLLFPLSGLNKTDYTRHDVERAIGNYLLHSGECSLLDKYSHCF